MGLDKHSSIPLYAQLRDLIMKRVAKGEYLPGQQIPSELDFCAELDLSRPTVRQAISELVADGILEIQKGKGTFVTIEPEREIVPHLSALLFSFLNLNGFDDLKLSPIKHLDSDAEVDKLFNIPSTHQHPGYWLVEWPLELNDTIVGRCSSYIPVQLFPELAQKLSAGKGMLEIKANKYAFLPHKGSLYLTCRVAKNREASSLDLPKRSHVIVLEGPLYARNGHVCEVLKIVLRPDMLKLEIN